MALINWPDAPTLNQPYTHEGRTWYWNGTGWLSLSTPEFYWIVPLGNLSSPLTVGTAKEQITIEKALVLHVVPRFSLQTAPTGSAFIFNMRKNGTSIFSTLPQIDATEFRSADSAVTPVLTGPGSSFAVGDVMRFDFDQVGATIAGTGPKAHIFGRLL